MVDPAHGALDERYTPEDDSQEAHSVFSDEGSAMRRPDNGVRKHDAYYCCYYYYCCGNLFHCHFQQQTLWECECLVAGLIGLTWPPPRTQAGSGVEKSGLLQRL